MHGSILKHHRCTLNAPASPTLCAYRANTSSADAAAAHYCCAWLMRAAFSGSARMPASCGRRTP